MAQVEKENVDLDVAEHLHQAYRLVFISSAWFRPLLCGFNDFSLVLGSQRGEGGLDGARHPCHARHARYPRQARSLGLKHGGEGGKCWGAVICPRNNRRSPYFGVIL